jgi:hypothetical protein
MLAQTTDIQSVQKQPMHTSDNKIAYPNSRMPTTAKKPSDMQA